jgi:hypothetical protein
MKKNNKRAVLRWSTAVALVLATALTALAQSNVSTSPAGEPPLDVRNGRASLVGHFNAPMQMRRLAFALVTPRPAEEEQFLEQLMTPGSPQFHKFLTADQWIARFGPAAADEQAVVDWATSKGLTVTHRFPNRLIVDVEAPMATIETALQVKINNYLLDGYTYFANEREPVLPDRLAGVVRDVEGLHNFPVMNPASSLHGPIPPGAIYNPGPVVGAPLTQHADGDRAKYEKARAASRANLVGAPDITNFSYDPADIFAYNAYDYDGLNALGHCCNPNGLSTGSPPQSSIAIAAYGNLHYTGSYPTATFTDIYGFQTRYPYLAFNVTGITVDGGPGFCTVTPTEDCGADFETTLDTEWSLATANSMGSYLDTAHVYVYQGEGGYPGDVVNQILSDGNAKVFTTSFSCGGNPSGEAQCPGGVISSLHSMFNSMNGQGWTLMSASGDKGATADCATTSVGYPSSDPDVVGVGGTTLFSGGLGGIFGGEVAWTGGTAPGSCLSNHGGSTGGCSVVFPTPPFQAGLTTSCGSQRAVPDIALNADFGQNIFWNGGLTGAIGTSIASPMVAGFFAQEGAYLIDLANVTGNACGTQHVACEPVDGGMGNGNYYLYYIGEHPGYAPHYPFYDITFGCNSNDITFEFSLTFYCAGPGYDIVTGWGTANMLQLAWAINTYIADDFGPPAVTFVGPMVGQFYNTPQNVTWSITGTAPPTELPNGVAGFSSAWDADPGDFVPTPGTDPRLLGANNSYFSGPQNTGTNGFLTLETEGCHTANVRAWDNGGTTSDSTYGPICYVPGTRITSLSPPSGVAGGAAFILLVNGTGFTGSSNVNFNGSPRFTTVFSATQLAAVITAADIAAAGWSQVTVSNPGGGEPVGVTFAVSSVGAAPPLSASGLSYVPITPCRVVDTRNSAGLFGAPAIAGGNSRDFAIPNGACNIPSTAAAYSLNVTAIPWATLGYLTIWPTGQPQPLVSTLNSGDGRVKANAAIVPAGAGGAVSVYVTDTTNVVLDISGYFVPATSNPSALAFFPLTPCRVADTRNPGGPLGGPSLVAGQARSFPTLSSTCSIPSTAQAYSLNFTAVPKGPLGYLTVWPTGVAQPLVSTLNALTGTVTANAAIVSAGTGGEISAFVTDDTDLVIDIDGYFAPGSGGQLFTMTPCRVLDTRQTSNGQATQAFSGELDVDVTANGCGVPAGAQAYVFNATVVPAGGLGYLTVWPEWTVQPYVSTLNAMDGAVTSNMAIVPTMYGSLNAWSVSAFAANPTQLVLDVFGYFQRVARVVDK